MDDSQDGQTYTILPERLDEIVAEVQHISRVMGPPGSAIPGHWHVQQVLLSPDEAIPDYQGWLDTAPITEVALRTLKRM